jgi:hypothetical protein
MRVRVSLAVLVCLFWLWGCGGGSKLVGTWQATNGSVTFEFRSGNKVDVTVPGGSPETGTYKAENGTLAIASDVWSSPEGDWMSYTIAGDTLTMGEGPSALTLTRVK